MPFRSVPSKCGIDTEAAIFWPALVHVPWPVPSRETCLPKVFVTHNLDLAYSFDPSSEIETSFLCDAWNETDAILTTNYNLRITRLLTEGTFTGGMNGKGMTEHTFVYHPTPSESAGGGEGEGESKPNSLSDALTASTYNGIMHLKGSVEGIEGEGEVAFEGPGYVGEGRRYVRLREVENYFWNRDGSLEGFERDGRL